MITFNARYSFVCLFLSLAFLSSCTNYEKAYQKNYDFPPLDSSKFDHFDEHTNKMFDMLTGASTGITFVNSMKFGFLDDNNSYVNYYNGGGVGVLNVNGDSLPDLYFTGNLVHDALYLNEGNMHFKDITAQAGIPMKNKGWSTGVAIADVNNDGQDDIYVLHSKWKDSLSHNLYVNNGDGTFTDRAKEYGIDCPDCYSMGAVFFDFDNDGDLDLYVKNHPTDWADRMRFNNFEKVEKGINQSDKFFRNDNGHFTDISKQAGINNHGYGLAVCAADLNNDGYQDVYGCNDFAMYDYLYMNNKNGTFSEESRNILNKTSMFSMGVDIADFDNDGYQDIVTADMRFNYSYVRRSFALGLRRNEFNNMVESGYGYQYVKNTLQRNNGNNTFSEIANLAGTDATDWSWGPLFCDFDNDGWKDIFIPNGYYRWLNVDEREMYQAMKDATRRGDSSAYKKLYSMISHKKLEAPKYIFKNNHDYTFTTETQNWGINYPMISQGTAEADLDNDGDMDLITNNQDRTPVIFRNNENELLHNNYIEFKFHGQPKNDEGIGTKVYLWTKNGMQMAEHHVVRGYQSSSEDIMHFGLAKDDTIYRVAIIWPDGKTQELHNVKPNQQLWLSYSNSENKKIENLYPHYDQLFTNAVEKLNVDYKHTENVYEDFNKELLLPHKMSRFGPGLAVADVNGDGLEDFYVTGAKDNPGELYLQTASGKFEKATTQPGAQDGQTDVLGALFFDANGDGTQDLYLVTGGNEEKANDPSYKDILYLNDGHGNFTKAPDDDLPNNYTSGSCVVAGDYDGDGKLDLFVGARGMPQHYPMPEKCAIMHNDGNGKFSDVTEQVAPELDKLGMICAATWTDFNNDGKLDLVLAGEWTPLILLENEGGKFVDVSKDAGIDQYTGWWNSIIAADFNNDGKIDFVVGNEGLNSRYYQPSVQEPVECYAADFDNNGTLDIIMSVYNHDKSYPVKTRMTMAEQIPSVGEKFPLYKQFALATTDQVFDKGAFDKAYHLKATQLASCYFENEGNGKFTMKPLPIQAQFSCIYGMVPFDVNNDGYLDIIAHGNFYSPETEVERQDACIGLTLINDGHGNFKPMSVQQSGFLSNKDAKALAVIYVGKEEQPVILGTNNNDKMIAYEFNNWKEQQKVNLTENDRFAMVFFKNGQTQKWEVYNGTGYLSESSKRLPFVPSLVDHIVVTNDKGEQRTVYENGRILAMK